MRSFAELIKQVKGVDSSDAVKQLGHHFRSPGHIPICIAAQDLLQERRGHTELVIALLTMAGLVPAGSGCEIMGSNGKAMTKSDVLTYAKNNHFVFLEGKDIIKAWEQWSP